MDWQDLFLSLDGRISRSRFWVGMAVGLVLVLAGLFLLRVVPYFGILLALVACLTAASVAVPIGTKRLHDRDKSGAWLVLFYAAPPILGEISDMTSASVSSSVFAMLAMAISIWSVIELGLLRGTDGTNQYGPDPLGAQGWRTA